jgi:hypothetical protein
MQSATIWRCAAYVFAKPTQQYAWFCNGEGMELMNQFGKTLRESRAFGKPMNAQHLPKAIRRWMGDSVGRWEADTLVVDTTNFK